MANNNGVTRGSVVSRSGSAYPSSQNGRAAASRISCNRCRKPLSTTVFVCSCDCVFCDECAYSHFNGSSSCPVCQKNLGAQDFIELVVADPSSATAETLKNTFQTIFTKKFASSNALSHQDMCTRLLQSIDDDRRAVRFLLKQFCLESQTASRQTGKVGRDYERLQKQHTHLQQAMSSQRIQTEQTIADLQHRVQALTGTVQEQQMKLDEKNTQINQFRQLYAADGMARVPSSSSRGSNHSNNSSGGGGNAGSGLAAGIHNYGGQQPQAHPTPPMPSFVLQKQARERAKEQALGELTRSHRGPPVAAMVGGQQQPRHTGCDRGGPSPNDVESIISPIQAVLPPHHQYHRYNSNNNMSGPHQPHGNHSGVLVPSTPRIRDLSAGTAYSFTSTNRDAVNNNKRQRMDSSSSSFSPGQQQHPSSYGFPSSSNSGHPPKMFGGFRGGRR